MGGVRLLAGLYQSCPHPFTTGRFSADHVRASLAERLSAQLNNLMEPVGGICEEHVATSTVVGAPLLFGDLRWADFRRTVGRTTPYAPQSFLNAYECAGWGYALRYLLATRRALRYMLISIIDVNFYNFEFWLRSRLWQRSGFGIATLLLDCSSATAADVQVGRAQGANAMAEFAMAVRRRAAETPGARLALPFFKQDVRLMLDRLLGAPDRTPDLHETWGHCFGSDPWLSMIDGASAQPSRFLVSSLALNGYFALAAVEVAENARLGVWPAQQRRSGGVDRISA